MPWCENACSELSGDVAHECGQCGINFLCNPKAADFSGKPAAAADLSRGPLVGARVRSISRTFSDIHTFSDCTVLDDVDSLWETMSRDPRPRVIREATPQPVDFVKEFSRRGQLGTIIDLDEFQVSQSSPYRLSASGYSPEIIAKVSKAYPLPSALSSVQIRPVISVGLKGGGERDLAHHYHPITALRLLQGEKIWALRAPHDEECAMNAGDCTDPFDVCAYYFRPNAPAPACVQRPGDTIIIPNGWFHGTCNNATLTVGWGGQGQRFGLEMHGTDENDSGQPLFAYRLGEPAPGSAPTFGLSEMRDVMKAVNQYAKVSAGEVKVQNMLRGWTSSTFQVPLMAVRSLWGEFLSLSQHESEVWSQTYLSKLECSALHMGVGVAGPFYKASPEVWGSMRRWTHAHLLMGLEDSDLSLAFRRHGGAQATGAIAVSVGEVAMWVGASLAELQVIGSSAQVALWCSAPMAEPHSKVVERAWFAESQQGVDEMKTDL